MPQMRLVMKWASRGSLPFMNTLYPRNMDEVLWHSATVLLPKSIFVYIPKLPTIRLIGSQFFSTSCEAPVGCADAVAISRSSLWLAADRRVVSTQYASVL